ncbi:MAG: class I poly(R)-hydroxyalkanoic acid synthase [Dehalococcoidia bacterium]
MRTDGTEPGTPAAGHSIDPTAFAANFARIGECSTDILHEALSADSGQPASLGALDLATSFAKAGIRAMEDPEGLATSQLDLMRQYADLLGNVSARATGEALAPLVEPAPGDRRFRDPAWSEHPAFDYMKQSYLLASQWVEDQLASIDGLDSKTSRKVQFFTRQFISAMAPSNFAFTNPEVVRSTIESNGENLARGLERMRADVRRGNGRLDLTTTDLDAFEVGESLATTPGKVVYQNRLMQLIQYEPTTEMVYRRPLLIVPPWINKYYVLDLRPENSFVRWAVDQGYTVFMVSWANPDESYADVDFEDYVVMGPLAALDAVKAATGEAQVSAVGYCIGGTALSMALAYMSAEGDERVTSATFLAAQVDFKDAGDLAVFTDEEQVCAIERRMADQGGVLDSLSMSNTFNLLRPDDLIWSNVVNHYLLGKEPRPFDLLYWNSDPTQIPGRAHSYYLRNMYVQNLLSQPDALSIRGVRIDLRRITTPLYVQSAEDDHIAPANSVFEIVKHVSGPIRFMLSGSGHIAGVINPPSANKYHYSVTPQSKRSQELQRHETLDEWKERATLHPGSWWTDWTAWLSRRSGRLVPARQPGDGALEVIEDAPGSYVHVRSTPAQSSDETSAASAHTNDSGRASGAEVAA